MNYQEFSVSKNIKGESLKGQLESLVSAADPEDIRSTGSYLLELHFRELAAEGKRNYSYTLSNYLAALNSYEDYQKQGEFLLGKKQPSLLESAIATLQRVEWLYSFLNTVPPWVVGCISGGSMSYGRFYNVRANYPESSDLDLLFVIDDNFSKFAGQGGVVLPSNLGFNREAEELFNKRLSIFKQGYEENEIDVLSHKFELASLGFDVSTHFIPQTSFRQMLSSGLKEDLIRPTTNDIVDVRLKDYKPSSFKHRTFKHKDFYGNEYPLAIKESPQPYGGVISLIPAYTIADNKLIPGMYHNLCSPLFEVFYDQADISPIMQEFRNLMFEHKNDLQETAHQEPRIAHSHIRQTIFSPYIKKEIDDENSRVKGPFV